MPVQRLWKVGACLPLVSLGALTPLAARAEPPSREAAERRPNELQTYLQAALRLYASLDYEQALEKLSRAKRYVHDLEDDVLVSFYEGIILADLNRKEQSRAAFRAGLLLKPDAQLPMKVSPKVAQDFEAVREEVRDELAALRKKEEAQRRAEAGTSSSGAQEKREEPGPTSAPSVEAPRPAIEPTVSTPGVTTASPWRSNGLSYGLMGGGVAMAGTGVFLGLSGLSFNERKKDMTIDEAVQARATASTQLTVGTVLLGAGLAALGTGTALLFLPRGEPGTADAGPKAALLLTPLPGGFALGSAGRF